MDNVGGGNEVQHHLNVGVHHVDQLVGGLDQQYHCGGDLPGGELLRSTTSSSSTSRYNVEGISVETSL